MSHSKPQYIRSVLFLVALFGCSTEVVQSPQGEAAGALSQDFCAPEHEFAQNNCQTSMTEAMGTANDVNLCQETVVPMHTACEAAAAYQRKKLKTPATYNWQKCAEAHCDGVFLQVRTNILTLWQDKEAITQSTYRGITSLGNDHLQWACLRSCGSPENVVLEP